MNEELKGLLIGAALVGGYFWWTRRGPRPDGRRSSSLTGATPTSTLAGAWRGSGSSSWMNRQPIVAPQGGGIAAFQVRGFGPRTLHAL